jgi:NAD(P)-dependent dehydrogenase (short-subunit alcohol dehydrogenase family)
MKNRIVLITGATKGIGKATALAFARCGARVIVHGRDAAKASAVADEIKTLSGHSNVSYLAADLACQADIHTMAQAFAQRFGQLDVLVNNAAVIQTTRVTTVDGLESTFAVNYLAPFLLTHLLLPGLKLSDHAHVINVSAPVQRVARIAFDDLQGEQKYSGFRANSQSKLAVLMFTNELAARLHNTSIRVNAFEPGMVDTDLTTTFMQSAGAVGMLMRLRGLSAPEDVAHIPVMLATAPEFHDATGIFFSHRLKPIAPTGEVNDAAKRSQLWNASAALTQVSQTAAS